VFACDHCGKHFSPFFYFDERLVPTATDRNLRAPPLPGQYRPVLGLSACWEAHETG
jgi:hypothetical protein